MREQIELITASRRNMILFTVFSAVFLFAVSMLLPQPAYAWPLDDLVNTIKDAVKGLAEDMLNSSVAAMNLFNMDKYLTAPFDQLLNPGKGSGSTYTIVTGIQTVVKTLGQSILAFALLMQLVKISQRIDSSATLPVVKEILILAVFFMVFSYLINHSFEICTAAYNEINNVISTLWSGNKRGEVANMQFSDTTDVGLDSVLFLAVVTLFMWVVTVVAAVIAYAMIFARAIQLYIMAACSPIPFSLMAFDETRQMGIGFCKNFLSVALAGLIIACLILVYPGLVGDILTSSGISMSEGKWTIDAGAVILSVVPIIACSFMYIFALLKSGSWARDILGG